MQGFHNNQMGGHLREKQNKRICQIYWLESGHGVLRMWAVPTYHRVFKTVFDWETKWLFTKGRLREWWPGETCHDCIWFLEQWRCYLQEHLYYLITFFCNLQDFIKELWIKYNSRLNNFYRFFLQGVSAFALEKKLSIESLLPTVECVIGNSLF